MGIETAPWPTPGTIGIELGDVLEGAAFTGVVGGAIGSKIGVAADAGFGSAQGGIEPGDPIADLDLLALQHLLHPVAGHAYLQELGQALSPQEEQGHQGAETEGEAPHTGQQPAKVQGVLKGKDPMGQGGCVIGRNRFLLSIARPGSLKMLRRWLQELQVA